MVTKAIFPVGPCIRHWLCRHPATTLLGIALLPAGELAKRACLYIGHLWEVECVAISEERGGSAIYLWVCRKGQDRTGQVLITGEDRDGWTEPGTLASSDFLLWCPSLPHSVAARREPCPEQSAGPLQISRSDEPGAHHCSTKQFGPKAHGPFPFRLIPPIAVGLFENREQQMEAGLRALGHRYFGGGGGLGGFAAARATRLRRQRQRRMAAFCSREWQGIPPLSTAPACLCL